jgi:hypothetical protein
MNELQLEMEKETFALRVSPEKFHRRLHVKISKPGSRLNGRNTSPGSRNQEGKAVYFPGLDTSPLILGEQKSREKCKP